MDLHRSTYRPPSQRGAALLILLLIVLLATTYSFVNSLSTTHLGTERQKKTDEALAQAKDALIAWSVLQGDIGTGTNPRPGTLPCPDTTNSGSQTGSCSALGGTTIGRLPWKTLGIDDLRDADGERLWYVLSDNFRRPGLNNRAINSDTQGSLQLYAADGITLLTPTGEELAAIIFSAGTPLAGQDRGAAPNIATNYLDSALTRNNASPGGPFISGPIKNTSDDTILNDRVLTIRAQELIKAVERRALKEAQNSLAAYAFANGGKYPNPAKPNGPNCATTISNVASPTTCAGDPSVCFGRFPEDIAVPLPAWFQQNGWGRVITYAVEKNSAIAGSAAECSTSLNVDGQGKKYLIIAPGSPKSGQSRPSLFLVDYLENTANSDAWTASSAQPSFTAPNTSSNDQLRSLP